MAYVKAAYGSRLFTKKGEITNWGEPSKHLLQCCTESGRPVAEACWQYLYVSVFVRDTWIGTGISHRVEDDGWMKHESLHDLHDNVAGSIFFSALF